MPLLAAGLADLYYRVDDFTDPWASRDTVMLQHGLGRSGNMYYGWVPHLAREFRVLRPDLPGAAQSPDPGQDIRYTLDGLLSAFIRLLDTLEVERVHYVGESLGGLLGIVFAATHPERVKSLTLPSTIVRVRAETTVALNSVGFPSWPEAIDALGMKGWWLRSRKEAGELSGDDAKDNWFAEESSRTPVHVAKALIRFASGVNAQSCLSQVRAPTLLLSQGRSPFTDLQEQQSILDAIPGSRQIVFPDGRHTDCYLRPDRYALATLEFLREVSGRPRQPLP